MTRATPLQLNAGRSIRWVADQLGHANPELTLRTYAHARTSLLRLPAWLELPHYALQIELLECKYRALGVSSKRVGLLYERSVFLAKAKGLKV